MIKETSLVLIFLVLFGSFTFLQFGFVPNANAASPETYYSGAGDGYVSYGGSSTQTWATVHNATSGDVASYTDTYSHAESYEDSEGTNWNGIVRSFLPFDTSLLPDGATITAANLSIYVSATVDEDNDGYDYVNVVQTTQASPSSLIVGDYNNCGAVNSPPTGATAIDITGISSSAYTNFALDATGISWINLTGWTYLGLREGHDISGHTIATNKDSSVTFSTSNYAGTSQDPYLIITYTVAGDTTKPTYSGVSTNSTVWAASCNFSVTINDETALHPNGQYIFGCNNTGTSANETAVNFTATSQLASIAKTLNSTNPNATSPMIVQFQWWFTDNAGNQNNTGLQTLTLCWQLSIGWNNVTIFEFDAGYTLSGTNASLNYDSINWSYIVYQNSSTTAQYAFVKNMSANNLIRVNHTTGILLIFCNEAGNWTHTYPYQGGDYGEDPTPYIVAAVSLGITVLAVAIYKKLRNKKKKAK
jgi:hypothetical protein